MPCIFQMSVLDYAQRIGWSSWWKAVGKWAEDRAVGIPKRCPPPASRFERKQRTVGDPSERIHRTIDSPRGRTLASRRIASVEPVFATIRHHKGMRRFTLRGRAKVSTQWQLYCLVHNIEKIATQAMRAG